MNTFEIAYSPVWRIFFSILGLTPSHSGITVSPTEMSCWMGWAFRLRVTRGQIRRAARTADIWWAVGVHVAPNARWIVNGSTHNIVTIELEPEGRGRCLGFPVRIRGLSVSVRRPKALLQALAAPVH